MPTPLALALAFALAAPVPPEKNADGPRPRAKLLGTLKLDKKVDRAMPLPDGKHVLLAVEGKGLVVPREQFGNDAAPKAVAEFDLPTGDCRLELTPDGTELVAVATAGTRLNAETRLVRWPLKEVLAGTAKGGRTVALEADNPTSVAFAADGKSLYAAVRTASPASGGNGQTLYEGKVVRVSAGTGDVTGEPVLLPDESGSFDGAAVHPASGRVFAQYFRDRRAGVRCVDATTGKEKWEQTISVNANQAGGHPPLVSPNGKVVAATCYHQVMWQQNAGPGQPPRLQPFQAHRPILLDAESGEQVADLGADNSYASGLGGFSADGKLLFGWLHRYGGNEYLVWDTATGKPLKTWERGGADVTAAFAPTGHELAIVERQTKPVYGTDQYGNRIALRTDHSSVVGLWDLAPLVK